MTERGTKSELMRHALLSGAVLLALGMAVVGYGRFESEPGPQLPAATDDGTRPGVLWEAVRAAAVGQAYDRADSAVRRGDRPALLVALDRLRRLRAGNRATSLALAEAESAVRAATQIEMLAHRAPAAQTATLKLRSARKYREALALAPDFNSSDPILLNSLGYFLAERGDNNEDFATAERLTRRAVEIWDQRIDEQQAADSGLAMASYYRSITRDSLAWALYRQGKYAEALREQQQAVMEGEISAPALSPPLPVAAELYFHLGEIYRALKRYDEARRQYQRALELEPDDEASQQALQKLPSPSGKPQPDRQAPSGVPDTVPEPGEPELGEEFEEPELEDPELEDPEAVPVIPDDQPLIARAPVFPVGITR